jgi:hypothetical protein
MVTRAAVVWTFIVPIAIANGALRQFVLVPFVGEPIARAVSSLILAGAVLLVTWLFLAWIGPLTPSDAWTIGVIWLCLTLAFEFLVGHYGFGTTWEALRAEYNLLAGRLWILVLVATVTAPPLMFRVHSPAPGGNVSAAGEARP